MYDIREEVDIDWGCDASGVHDDKMDNALRSFGYISAHQIGYDETDNYQDVKNEFKSGRPGVFSGCNKDHIPGIFPVARDCRAWVGDGYRFFTACPSGNGYFYFHMNWGWNDSYNGFYGYNDLPLEIKNLTTRVK